MVQLSHPYMTTGKTIALTIWMWELDHKESWAPNNWRFWIVALEKTLESPLDFKKIKPLHPKGNQSQYTLELDALMLNLKLQYFGHLMWRADSLEKALMLRKIEGRRRRGRQRMRWLDGITHSRDMVLSQLQEWWTGKPGVLHSMGLQRVGTWLNYWTVLNAWYAFWPVICLSCTLSNFYLIHITM